MNHEQVNLDSLNKVISVQSELIIFLKAEVERLKASQTTTNPLWWPSTLPYPGQPYIPPDPGMVRTPWYNPPFIATYATTGSGGIISQTSLPLGSAQS